METAIICATFLITLAALIYFFRHLPAQYLNLKYPPVTQTKDSSSEIEELRRKINNVNKIASAASLAVGIKTEPLLSDNK